MKQKCRAARRRFLEEQRLDRIWEARGDDQSNIPKMVRSTEACTSSLERPVEGGSGSAQSKVEEGGGRPQLDQTRPGRESRSKQVNLEGFHWRPWDGLAPSTARPHVSRLTGCGRHCTDWRSSRRLPGGERGAAGGQGGP